MLTKLSREYSYIGKRLFMLISAMLVMMTEVVAQSELNVVENTWLKYSDANNALYHYITGEAVAILETRRSVISGLHTLTGWKQRQDSIKETLLNVIGPFPEKTPLNPRITGTVKKEGFKVENIVFESQPKFYVTSSMFIPSDQKTKGKLPAIIYCSGHTEKGYRDSVYLHVIINLVKKGFIVFAFDPVGQGERLEYFDSLTGKSKVGGPTAEHSYPGDQAFILGSSLARYMVWDGIRAIDYLMTRKEVDPARIGITGRSGGGTQCAYIAAIDNRIYAAAPENYLTNFTRLLQSIGPQDAEQELFNEISRGIDHGDFLIARAPKPTLMITTTRDMFSIQGAMETEREVSNIYRYYGKETNFKRVEDDASHESTKKNRESMYAFFQKELNNPGDSVDEETQPLASEDIRVTSTGQVSTSLGGETVFSLNRRHAKELVNKLQYSRNDLKTHLLNVLHSAKKLSGYNEPESIGSPVFTGRIRRDGYVIEKYFVKGGGEYIIPYLLIKPEKPDSHKALIYLHPSGKGAEMYEGGEIEWFVKQGFTVLAPDLIGVGEMRPLDVLKKDDGSEASLHGLWYESMLIGRSIVGIQAGDVARLSKLLKTELGIGTIYGLAREDMVPVLLHAASFDPAITHLALIGSCFSYSSIVLNRFYKSSFIPSTVPGALKAYDLPDLAACLAPRKLLMVRVSDGGNDNIESISKDLSIVKTSYKYRDVGNHLVINLARREGKPYDLYSDWIE